MQRLPRTLRQNALCRSRVRKSTRGVTLIELMIVIVIMVILASIAVPSFQRSLASSKISSTTNELLSAIAETRSRAIKIGSRVTLCKSSDGATCATSNDWQQGWIMLNDNVRAGSTASVDSGDTLIRNYQMGNTGSILIKGSASLDQYLSYGADGTGKTMGGAPLTGTIRICSTSSTLKDTERARDLVMSFTGRVVLSKPVVDASCPAPT